MKKVSFIVRTCGRPHVLKYSLQSIREQTYPNIEVIVVEDGENLAEQMIATEFSDMDIKYYNTGKREGRARVGNIAMEMASGEFLNFLDDDDLLYPNHTEILMNYLQNGEKKVAYTVAHEGVSRYSKAKQKYVTLYKRVRYRQPFCRLYLTMNNYFPIQTVMFHKSLFDMYGGFREHLDVLEDWDLWLRYASHEDFEFIDRITSIYRVPIKWFNRDRCFYTAYDDVTKLFAEYSYQYNFKECNDELLYIVKDLRYPKWKKFLRKVKKKLYGN